MEHVHNKGKEAAKSAVQTKPSKKTNVVSNSPSTYRSKRGGGGKANAAAAAFVDLEKGLEAKRNETGSGQDKPG